MARRNMQGRPGSSSSPRISSLSNTMTEQRSRLVIAVFLLVAFLFFGRLFYLQVIAAEGLSEEATNSRTVPIELSAKRGTIYDRNGNVLATSVDAKTIYCNPRDVSNPAQEARELASVLGGEENDWEDLMTQDTTFVYLKKQVELDLAQKVQDLQLDGVYFLNDSKRVYPYGQIGGQVIGLIDSEGQGLTGLELYYNDILAGSSGTLTAQYYGDSGATIPGSVTEDVPAVDGEDIVISLDIGMQEYLENRLVQAKDELEAGGGNSILYDGGTGEIYACASLPYLNPNDREKIEEGSTELKSMTQAYEPGSIFKTVTFSAIMEAGLYTPDDKIFCPAYLPADEFFISDAHDRGDQEMSVRQILDQSSNVGTSLMARALGFRPLYDKILKYNLNEITGVDYPGESNGLLSSVDEWSTIQAYNISFGQGISVTPLQITRFYGALTNGGVECTPHFLIERINSDEEQNWATEQVFDNQAAIDTVTNMLTTVVTEGTGQPAAIEGYTVAGKTGTAEYALEEGGYAKGSYHISFVGYLPNSNSKLVCFVGATEVPGDRSTASAFSDIMSFAAERYRIVAK